MRRPCHRTMRAEMSGRQNSLPYNQLAASQSCDITMDSMRKDHTILKFLPQARNALFVGAVPDTRDILPR